MASLPEALARHSFFGRATAATLTRLAGEASVHTVTRRGLIVQDGDRCPGLHLVLDGVVQVCRVAASGRTFVFRLVRAGDSFGEEVLFAPEDRAPARMNASAVTDARMLVVPAASVRAAVVDEPALVDAALALLSERVLAALERQQQLALDPPAQRIAQYLLDHADGPPRNGSTSQTVYLDVPKATVAHYLGTVPEVLARHLRRFEKRGALRRCGNGTLELTDSAALGRCAAGLE
jgi:CRP-like cAMP-binding protein